ncbi:CPBP family intramembrane glutamic endopeptidase [Kaistella antarctica]|uniref:CAAX amino terminal protease self- immunity n=1 Tax=Kaistella antarctica TaxID=266748 RepID=A0A448NUZ2_9FLAO|nr:CPBP family intramembrane glutamic endopeptidase [Kaistella antarctica]KEY20324.1 hypothetical protein HY04_03730 [Kaistella antarctica]SEV91005.1 CAAX protease self-immunity [Kaistella antarctica]VEI01552.1 CAAX amino terminal protease self- immunity [Kaistella antarctica]
MTKNVLGDFYKFLLKPNDHQLQLKLKDKFRLILILMGFEILVTLVVILPLLYLIDFLSPLKQDRIDYSETFVYLLVLFVFVVPLIEEVIFRLFLSYRRVNLVISKESWTKLFPYLVYIPTLIFGFLHLGNFNNDNALFYILSPLVILSQLFGGLVISFIRVRLNFFYSTFYHFIWNFLFAIAVPFLLSVVLKPYTEQTSQYKIVIEELPFFVENEEQTFNIDSTQSRISSVQLRQYSVQHLLDSLYSKDKYFVDDVLINLDFKSTRGLKKEEFLEILKKEYKIR